MVTAPHAMHLLDTLSRYRATWCTYPNLYEACDPGREIAVYEDFVSFVRRNSQCFERSNQAGHMTGSALVVSSDMSKVLLTHHRKLGLWLQLGGHADGHPELDHVAMTEAIEESGLTSINFLEYERELFSTEYAAHPLPFDLDCHAIPARRDDPAHLHYDVRYLVVALDNEVPVVSEESHDVRWFTLDDARKLTSELSMHRQFDKVASIRRRL